MTAERAALAGEPCTCGRQAVTVFVRDDGSEIGYCGFPDGGDRAVPVLRWSASPPALGRSRAMSAVPAPAQPQVPSAVPDDVVSRRGRPRRLDRASR